MLFLRAESASFTVQRDLGHQGNAALATVPSASILPPWRPCTDSSLTFRPWKTTVPTLPGGPSWVLPSSCQGLCRLPGLSLPAKALGLDWKQAGELFYQADYNRNKIPAPQALQRATSWCPQVSTPRPPCSSWGAPSWSVPPWCGPPAGPGQGWWVRQTPGSSCLSSCFHP